MRSKRCPKERWPRSPDRIEREGIRLSNKRRHRARMNVLAPVRIREHAPEPVAQQPGQQRVQLPVACEPVEKPDRRPLADRNPLDLDPLALVREWLPLLFNALKHFFPRQWRRAGFWRRRILGG